MTSDKKTPTLTADDLSPLVEKLPPEEQLRLAYYALRIARSLAAPERRAVQTAAPQEGLPDMADFHARLGVATYPGNAVIEMRDEDDR